VSSPRSLKPGLRGQPALRNDKAGDIRNALARLQIGEDERPLAAHAPRAGFRHAGIGTRQRGEADLVDHQQIGAR
jgi:hypothetical protein